jgi:fumarate reductase subunit C
MSTPALASPRGGRLEAWLYIVQRLSALILAPLVIGHLVVIMIAVRGGLSAQEILSRTQSNAVWPLFYGLFVAAAALHGAVGLRAMAREILPPRRALPETLALVFMAAVLLLGFRAVAAIG